MADKPSDAELKAMWQLHAADIGGIFCFARAVLAKWGTPAPVGGEPVARLEIGKTKGGVSLTHIAEPAAFQLQEGRYALYTAPQPVERERLTDEQIDRAIAELGLNYLADAHATNRAVLRKLCRHAHGIKGGQHG